jgi:hypothetical protein
VYAGYLEDADDAAEAFPTSIAFSATTVRSLARYDAAVIAYRWAKTLSIDRSAS